MNKKRILVCGAGSIGIFLGTLLSSKGNDVKLFGKRKLKSIGEEIVIKGRKYKLPEKIYSLPKNEKFDFVLITTKLYDLGKMVKMISRNKIKTKILASIQNGLVDDSIYSKFLNHNRVIPVTVFSGFQLFKNKLKTNSTDMGWKTEYSKKGKQLSKLISSIGIKCRAEKKLDSFRAEKTIVNSCLNGLSAIEKKPFCKLFSDKKIEERILKLFEECYNILVKRYKLENAGIIRKRMYKNWRRMNHYSSTYQDVVSNRNNEIDFFNGYIVRLGRRFNMKTEENESLLRDFRKLVKK